MSTSTKLLQTTQLGEWHALVEKLPAPLRDVHFLPEMMLPYEEIEAGLGVLLVEQTDSGYMIQPLLRDPIGFVRHPYNFGGPVANEGYRELGSNVPCICTLNPFFANHQNELLGNKAEFVKESVWADLEQPIKMRGTTRHTYQKSVDAGVTFEPAETNQKNISLFSKMYDQTMDRVGADPHWRFPQTWFEWFFHHLPERANLFFAMDHKEPVAGCILLHGYGTCYYHFASSLDTCDPGKGTNHCMVFNSMLWAKEHDCSKFHLGGGVDPDDGVFRFKAGFSELRAPVYRFDSKGSTKCRVA